MTKLEQAKRAIEEGTKQCLEVPFHFPCFTLNLFLLDYIILYKITLSKETSFGP